MTVAGTPETWHLPRRPGWDWVICREPWPCAPARVDLLEEYGVDRTGLVLYLSLQMIDAIDDMATGGKAPSDLHRRFIDWARPGPQRD